MSKQSPTKNPDKSVLESNDLNFGRESVVRVVGGRQFQQSIDLLKKDEKNFAEPLVGFCNSGKGVRDDLGGIYNLK